MPKFKVLVQRHITTTHHTEEEKWFEIEAETGEDAEDQALKLEYTEYEKHVYAGWVETDDWDDNEDSESEVLEVEELPEGKFLDLPGQMKMFEDE